MGNIFTALWHTPFTVDYDKIPTYEEIEAVKAKYKPKGYVGTPLFEAAVSNDIESVSILLRSGEFKVTDSFPPDGMDTLKMVIACSNDPELIDVLLKAPGGMECLNAPNDDGWTPLHYAALRDSVYTKLLLSYEGINVWLENKNGDTALDLAQRFQSKEIIQLLKLVPEEVNYELKTILKF